MKSKIGSICFVLSGYPTEKNPINIFVKQLIYEIADMGIRCTIISPYSITHQLVHNTEITSPIIDEYTEKGNKITIYFPKYISFSAKKYSMKFTEMGFKKAVFREFKKREITADAVYGHFIFPSGLAAESLGVRYKIPTFLACGEGSNIFTDTNRSYLFGLHKYKWNINLNKLTGIISVSSENKRLLVDEGYVNKEFSEKIEVFPNSINNKKFFKMDKVTVRKELGIPQDAFIVAFTGTFDHRKGSERVSEALNKFDDVYSIFIGQGKKEPTCKNIIFKGLLPHDEVSKYLNAANVFVLPTLGEGCCNAIIEALACGLPVISSDEPFNDDILNKSNSIRINPEDIDSIYEAINLIHNNIELQNSLTQGALATAEKLNIKQRASNIIDFMERSIKI